ncbi:MAG: ISAzo13 family transposase [Saprospiraceae bacterium]
MLSLIEFIERYKAGSPTDETIYWIHLKPSEIAIRFLEETGNKVSNGFIKRLLKSLGYKYKKLKKSLAIGKYANRNEQFQIIFNLVTVMSLNTPVLSIDCKKKERLGNLYREGKCYCTASIPVFDHDYYYLGEGKVIPHGIYDLSRNEGYVTIGNSHETAESIKDNLLWWWDNYGINQYSDCKTILILCDAGGANSYRHHVFKKEMLELAKLIGRDIIICHYPPYASKWNPIEHRLFAHVHHAMKGSILSNYDFVKELISKTTTSTGLKVVVRLHLKKYTIGIKTKQEEVDYSRIQFNKNIPELSYRIAS